MFEIRYPTKFVIEPEDIKEAAFYGQLQIIT